MLYDIGNINYSYMLYREECVWWPPPPHILRYYNWSIMQNLFYSNSIAHFVAIHPGADEVICLCIYSCLSL